ncbi:hypothetical protein EDB86DRAFT_1405779 [Lactarius hatsudake]|nr:hypothetical protein EDB86DRAFT_1405779 [Lactarius hatsudake]
MRSPCTLCPSAGHVMISFPLTLHHLFDNPTSSNRIGYKESSCNVGDYWPLFDKYLEKVRVKDEDKAENWKAEASDTASPNIHHMLTRLLQSGLFSAMDATSLDISSGPSARSAGQAKPTFYLKNIYQLLADPNGTHVPSLPSPPAFFPPKSSVWVNSFWFLSLVKTLLLAILLQQWTR